MINVKSTKQITGVEISGDYEDLNALYSALTNVIGEEGCYEDYYSCSMHVLGLCYDIRHAYQGDRNEFNSEDDSKYYSFNVLWPEIMFVVAILGDYLNFSESRKCYLDDPEVQFFGENTRELLKEKLPDDIALIRYFQNLVWNALAKTIGEKRFKKLRNSIDFYILNIVGIQRIGGYYTQMIDILNVKYIGWKPQYRESHLAGMIEKIVKPNYDYNDLKKAVDEYALEVGVPYYKVMLEGMEYPEEIEW
jgi:hypothetical protein